MRAVLFLLLILISLPGISQSQDVRSYFFSHYTTRNGLSSNHIKSITQDKKGFLWIVTLNGLQRFDGHSFVSIRNDPSKKNSIPADEVLQVLMDKKDNLWLLFSNGRTGILNTNSLTFHEAKVMMPDWYRQVDKHLYIDSRNNVMLILDNLDMLTYHPGNNTFSSQYNLIPLPNNWHLWRIVEDTTEKKYWIASDSGLLVYNYNTRQLSYRETNPGNEAAISFFKDRINIGVPFIDSKKRLWFQTWTNAGAPSFFCYDLIQKRPLITDMLMAYVMRGYTEPKQLVEHRDGRLFLTGYPMLSEFDEEKKAFVQLRDMKAPLFGSEFNFIQHSFSDREHNIWLCTRNDGLYRFNPSAQLFSTVTHYNPHSGLPGISGVLALIEMRDSTFIASTWGEGVLRYNRQLQQVPLSIKGIPEKNGITIWSMLRRRNGELWFGLQDDGGNIMIHDEQKNESKQFRIFERVTIRQLVEDPQGNVWIGTQNKGVYKWTASKGIRELEDGLSWFEAIPKTMIFELTVDSSGHLWVGTIARGIFRIDTKTDTVVEELTQTSLPGILNDRTGPILQYNDSLMLFGAGGLNIYNKHTKKMSYITTADGLPSAHVMSMLKDDQGFVWLGMRNGLCRVNIFTKAINYFDREDGMVNDNFSMDAARRLSDGRLLFGTNKDFLAFYPGKIITNTLPPDVMITDFRLSNKPLRLDSLLKLEAIELSYDNNSIAIDFASLTNLPQNKITYHYMLQGVDKHWIKAGDINRAIYPYLAPGKYVFSIRAENTDGAFSRNTTRLTIEVSPPFWRSWWFYSLLILTAALILYILDRERMKRKELIHQMRSKIAGNLHEDINTALNNINILSEMAKLKADKEPEKSKEFLEQIHARSHNMIIAMDDMLWSIDPENDNMRKSVLRMKEYIDELNSSEGTDIVMVIDEKVNRLSPGMEFRHEAFILFKESIQALMKACVSSCMIHVGVEKAGLVYTIEFKNRCCDLQAFRHLLERQDIQRRLSILNAKSRIEIHKESSILELVLPTTA